MTPFALTLPPEALEAIVERETEQVLERLRAESASEPASPSSPFMTVVEAAAYLRCSRQRVDDLLSQGRLTRHKDGSRTLVSRVEVEEHLRHEERRA